MNLTSKVSARGVSSWSETTANQFKSSRFIIKSICNFNLLGDILLFSSSPATFI